MGKKAPHTTVIPLRKRHHDEFYTVGKLPWEAKYGNEGKLGCLGAKPYRHRCWIMPLAAAMRRCDLPKALESTAAIICIFSWAFCKLTMAVVRISTSLGSRSSCMALISHRHPASVNPLEHGLPRLPGANTAACPRRLTTFEINTPRSATDQANRVPHEEIIQPYKRAFLRL